MFNNFRYIVDENPFPNDTSAQAHQRTSAPAGPERTANGTFAARLIGLAFAAFLLLPARAADSLHVSMQVSNYNGFQVSCFGEKNGWINLSVSGGTAPYTYKWSNGAGTQNINELAAGYYKVDVIDSDERKVTAEVTLEQPLPMKPDVDVYEYSNGYNTSCYACSNGNASVQVLGGAPPFTISWSDGPTGASRYNLEAKDYKITVADANGCAGVSTTIYLRGPDRSDWSMNGNPNTTPGPQYIGTPDNKDVVFKSHAQERLRLLGNGGITLADTSIGEGLLWRGSGGVLKGGGFPTFPELPPDKCRLVSFFPFWETRGNTFPQICPDQQPILGTMIHLPLPIYTNGVERMRVTETGKVGIGTMPPGGEVGDYRLFVENGIACRDVLVKLGDWPDFVFQPNYGLMPMEELRQFLRNNSHLPGIPSAAEVNAKKGVEVGDLQRRMLKVAEEQALYILQLEEKYRALEQRLEVLEASQQ